jgi:hypothetical protein
MNFSVFFILLLNQLDITGYAESRPYLAIGDSINFFGYNRGWLEFKHDGIDYGAQIGFDCLAPFDTTFVSIAEYVKISRMAVWLGPTNRRIIAGRQSLYWGAARVFRPLDILNRANYFEPTYERPGTDAILGYLSIGDMTSLRGIVVPRYNPKKSIYGLRVGTNILKNDLGIDILYRSSPRMTTVGAEITGEAEIGYWVEFSYTFEDTTEYPKVSIGVDYTFPFMVYAMVEFFYDKTGQRNPADYSFEEILLGRRSTLAQEYLYGSVSLVQNPFFRPSINTIVNLNDRGFIFIPQINRSLFDNAELILGSNIFIGPDDCEFKNLVPYDAQVYIWAKVYF